MMETVMDLLELLLRVVTILVIVGFVVGAIALLLTKEDPRE